MNEIISEFVRDGQEALMIQQTLDSCPRPRCPFGVEPMEREGSFWKCDRHKLLISNSLVRRNESKTD